MDPVVPNEPNPEALLQHTLSAARRLETDNKINWNSKLLNVDFIDSSGSTPSSFDDALSSVGGIYNRDYYADYKPDEVYNDAILAYNLFQQFPVLSRCVSNELIGYIRAQGKRGRTGYYPDAEVNIPPHPLSIAIESILHGDSEHYRGLFSNQDGEERWKNSRIKWEILGEKTISHAPPKFEEFLNAKPSFSFDLKEGLEATVDGQRAEVVTVRDNGSFVVTIQDEARAQTFQISTREDMLRHNVQVIRPED